LPERFEDHGSRVLVLGRLVGASRLEEGDLDVPVSWVWTVRAGRIVAMQAFLENARRETRSHVEGVAQCPRRWRAIEGDRCASLSKA
jgi:hypothetical protein